MHLTESTMYYIHALSCIMCLYGVLHKQLAKLRYILHKIYCLKWYECCIYQKSNILLQVLRNILKNGPERNDYFLTIRRCSNQAKNDTEQVSIGDITVTVRPPRNVEVVPVKYLQDTPPQSVLHHLKWIMQKDGLKQDVFLIGR